jgi:4-nitrophenyl phosphatase
MVIGTVAGLTGFTIEEHDVITSALVTASALKGLAARVLIVGTAALTDTFRSNGFTVVTDWREAEAVACGMDFDLTYDKLAAATLAIRNGALFYATNTDATYPTDEGQKPGGGAIVAALQTATGREPVVCGKPHEPVGDAIRAVIGAGDVLVVGDRFETDIALGKIQGWTTALVLSGIVTDGSAAPPGLEPDIVIDSLADLPAVLAGS